MMHFVTRIVGKMGRRENNSVLELRLYRTRADGSLDQIGKVVASHAEVRALEAILRDGAGVHATGQIRVDVIPPPPALLRSLPPR